MKAALWLPLLVLLSVSAAAATLPAHQPRPGGVAVLAVGSGDAPPTVTFGERRALVMRDGDAWYAVIGIPLSQATGPASVEVSGDGVATTRVEFEVVPHAYREQRLTVEAAYVEPDPEQLERIAAERKVIDAALHGWRPAPVESLLLAAPVAGKRSPSFGFRRFFNDQPRAPHSGMDIAANRGTTVVAPGAGTVAATGHYFFNGNTVLLDHGQGFVTMYCHLDRIDVADAQVVEAGTPLGVVGATGRVTGAHLHFGTYLGGAAVDPAILLAPAD